MDAGIFNYAKNPNERFVDFYKEDIDCHYFDMMIDVPGHIQMQGYDQMQYINTMPMDGHEKLRPPHISSDDNPVEVTFAILK